MKPLHAEHLVIVRTSGSIININSYNCQELGLAKALKKKGLHVTLILAGNVSEVTSIDGIIIYYCKFMSINQQIAWFCDIDTVLKKIKPTLIQVHDMGLLMSWRVVRWAKDNAIPSFLIQGNYAVTQKPVFRQLESLFNHSFGKYILNNVKGVGYKTPRAAQYLELYQKRNMAYTYVGLDPTKFSLNMETDIETHYHIKGKKVLLYVGTIESRRNPFFLIELLEAMPKDYTLLLVGDGPLYEKIKETVKNKKLNDRFILLGKKKQDELPSLYRAADLFLLPSSYEIYGMVILEAMYFGLPVVSSLTAGSESIIEDAVNGYIIPSFDIQLWRTVIIKHIENVGKAMEMKITAEATVKEKYLWDKASENFLNLYFGSTQHNYESTN